MKSHSNQSGSQPGSTSGKRQDQQNQSTHTSGEFDDLLPKKGGTGSSTKKDSSHEQGSSSGTRGGTHEQHVKAGQQSHKNS